MGGNTVLNWLSRAWLLVGRLWRLAIVKGIIGGVLTFLVMAAISGLIEDAFPRWVRDALIPWLSRFSTVSNWLIVVVPMCGVLAVIAALRLFRAEVWLNPRDVRTLRYAKEYMHYKEFFGLMNCIDGELRQSLEKQDGAGSLHRFVDSLFVQTLEFFGPEVRTSVIFRPKKDDPEWLGAWRANPGHYLTDKNFYIGQRSESLRDRGCAGRAFVENVPIRYNIIDPRTGEADQPCKKAFADYEAKKRGPDYLSSAVLPIRWNTRVVGVLCIDSKRRDFFTDDDIAMIQAIADRIGDALYLHKELD